MSISKHHARGFTLSEILAVISIIAALAALVAPMLGETKAQAKKRVCASNLHEIGVATEIYLGDYDQTYPLFVNAVDRRDRGIRLGRPPGSDPFAYPTPVEVLGRYVDSDAVFRCPSDRGTAIRDFTATPFLYPENGGTSYLFRELFDIRTPEGWRDPTSAAFATDGSARAHSMEFDERNFKTWFMNALHYDWHVKFEQRNSPTILESPVQ